MISRRIEFEECTAVRMGDNGPETCGYVRVKGEKDPEGVAFVKVVNTFTARCNMSITRFATCANKTILEGSVNKADEKEDESDD